MTTRGFLITFICFSVFTIAFADRGHCTEQERDVVLLDGVRHFFATLPPTGLWETSATEPFDVQRTSNWKGYEASWEIKDNKLFLTAFSAKIKGKQVDPKQLFKSELPCQAIWVNGPLYLADDFYGKNTSGHYTRTMERFFCIDGTVHKKEKIKNEMRFNQGRLGLRLSDANGALVIENIADKSPSQECGELSVGDKIIALIDTDNERMLIDTMPVEKATQFLRGIVGQPVRIEVQGATVDSSKIVELTRVLYFAQGKN